MRATARELVSLAALVLAVGGLTQWWASRQELQHGARLGAQVAVLAGPGDIRMLGSEVCAACKVARHWFAEHEVPFKECSIERDSACRADFQATQASGTPVLLVRGQAQVGFSPDRVLAALASSVR